MTIRSMAEYLASAEADPDWNDAQRKLIVDFAEKHGQAWLGRVNRSANARACVTHDRWDGGIVYNFGADFAVPRFDAELDRLLLQREAATYRGVVDDAARVTAIFARIAELGGITLVWT